MTRPARALRALVPGVALAVALFTAPLAVAQNFPAPYPHPDGVTEPGYTSSPSVVAEGTGPTGVRWRLQAVTSSVGLCVILATTGSKTVPEACGVDVATTAQIQAWTGRWLQQPPQVDLEPAVMKAVRAAMPEEGLGFVFGTASTTVAVVTVNGSPVIPAVSAGTGFWVVPLTSAQAVSGVTVQAVGDTGAVLNDQYYEPLCGPGLVPPRWLCAVQPFKVLLDIEETVLNLHPPTVGPGTRVTSRAAALAANSLAATVVPTYRADTVLEARAQSAAAATQSSQLIVARGRVELREDRLYTVRMRLTGAGRRWLRRVSGSRLRLVARTTFTNGRRVTTGRTIRLGP